jgi:hypothetical protein
MGSDRCKRLVKNSLARRNGQKSFAWLTTSRGYVCSRSTLPTTSTSSPSLTTTTSVAAITSATASTTRSIWITNLPIVLFVLLQRSTLTEQLPIILRSLCLCLCICLCIFVPCIWIRPNRSLVQLPSLPLKLRLLPDGTYTLPARIFYRK